MKKKIALFLFTALSGCASFPDDSLLQKEKPSETPHALMPLSIKNSWRYQIKSNTPFDVSYKLHANDSSIFEIVRTIPTEYSLLKEIKFLRNQNNGLVALTTKDVPNRLPFVNYRFEFPTKAGKANADRDGNTTTCVASDTIISTKTGPHKVWRYQMKSFSENFFFDFIPDTGLVRLVSLDSLKQDTVEATSWIIK